MIAVDPILLANSEAGTGIPVFTCTISQNDGVVSVDLGTFEVLEARLTRLKYFLKIHEDVLGAVGMINSTSGDPWQVQVTRGLVVGGVSYDYTSRSYYITKCSYLANEHCTIIEADLLPYTAISQVTGDQSASQVLNDALTQLFITDYAEDATRDIWYGWNFYPSGKTLSLYDGRSLSAIIANKYFAYFFPRAGGLYAYNVPSNNANPEDGTYNPFSHAQIKKYVNTDFYLNLAWSEEYKKKTYVTGAAYAYHNLGFIRLADDPSADADFQDWGLVHTDTNFVIIQRPDFRLEQGDLVNFGFVTTSYVYCLEIEEIFKRGSAPRWYQVIRSLPYHPQAISKSNLEFINYTPPGGEPYFDPPPEIPRDKRPHDGNPYSGLPWEAALNTDNFNNALSLASRASV